MNDPSVLETLRGVAFLQDLPQEHLEELASIARTVEFPARRAIFSEFDAAQEVYLIVSGNVSVVACEPDVGCRQLTTIGGGELLGWSPVLERSRMSATAQTLTPTKALVFNGEKLRSLCKKNAALGYEFMHRVAGVLADRLFATRAHLFKLSGRHLPEVVLESD